MYNEFTISDTLVFFGRIHGLTWRETQARMDFLIDFLDLPQKGSLVRNLRSGRLWGEDPASRFGSKAVRRPLPPVRDIDAHVQTNAAAISPTGACKTLRLCLVTWQTKVG